MFMEHMESPEGIDLQISFCFLSLNVTAYAYAYACLPARPTREKGLMFSALANFSVITCARRVLYGNVLAKAGVHVYLKKVVFGTLRRMAFVRTDVSQRASVATYY
jgi:hypothetical protein